MNRLERRRRLELAGITAWAERELTIGPMHVSQLLLEKHWGDEQPAVDRVLRAMDELRVAIHTLENEIAPAALAQDGQAPAEGAGTRLVDGPERETDVTGPERGPSQVRSLLRWFSSRLRVRRERPARISLRA